MVYLGDAKLRVGQTIDAARFYKQALERVPNSSRLHLSLAFAYVKATRYADARQTLEAALKAQPIPRDRQCIGASFGDGAGRIRPRRRSRARARERLFEATKDPDAGQSYAMALAETGRFNEAIVLQRETITVLAHTGGSIRSPFSKRTSPSIRATSPPGRLASRRSAADAAQSGYTLSAQLRRRRAKPSHSVAPDQFCWPGGVELSGNGQTLFVNLSVSTPLSWHVVQSVPLDASRCTCDEHHPAHPLSSRHFVHDPSPG
jgi:tetratricopeptide (TPR) repeat protein